MRISHVALAVLGLDLGSVSPGLAELPSLTVLIPSNPGGGWDQTGRVMEQALRAEKSW